MVGQIDDFEDGTTMGWMEGFPSPNPPVNIASCRPAGTGDNYLQNISSGGFGPGSAQVMFNHDQWTGILRGIWFGGFRSRFDQFDSYGIEIAAILILIAR